MVPEPKVRTLTAGAISAVLDNGALRYIKLGDIEVMRAIAFLVRDENWGTFNPEISNLKIKQGKTSFSVSYDARCADAKRALAYHAEITCADGDLLFSAAARPESDFHHQPHRLHGAAPADRRCRLQPVEIEHARRPQGEGASSRLMVNPILPLHSTSAR